MDKERLVQATRSVWLNMQAESEPAPQLERASTSLSPLVTQIIHNRGLGADDVQRFLRPDLEFGSDPFLLLGMRAAVDRILAAQRSGESVAVYGDFDVDGVTSTAVLVQALTMLEIKVVGYIPHRHKRSQDYEVRKAHW